MSSLVLAIAAAHAIPPIAGGFLGRTEKSVIIGSVIACGLAIASGSPVFIISDLVGVGVGTWIGLSIVNNSLKESNINKDRD